MPHGITQCYLPPGRGDIPALSSNAVGLTSILDRGQLFYSLNLSAESSRPASGPKYHAVSQ